MNKQLTKYGPCPIYIKVEDVVQKKRDERKDRILQEAGLKLIRIKTTDVDVQDRIEQQLRRG